MKMESALMMVVLVWVTFVLMSNSNSNLIMASTVEMTTMFDQSVALVEVSQVLAMALWVEPLSVILVAENPHPLNQLRVHDSDDILSRWRVCISYCSLVLGIPIEQVK